MPGYPGSWGESLVIASAQLTVSVKAFAGTSSTHTSGSGALTADPLGHRRFAGTSSTNTAGSGALAADRSLAGMSSTRTMGSGALTANSPFGDAKFRWRVEAQISPADPNAWVSLSHRVIVPARVSRGRQTALDRVEAGESSLVIDNADRLLDPDNEASIYHGGLRPGRGVRVFADVDGNAPVMIHRGTVDSWQPVKTHGEPETVGVDTVDIFERLHRVEVPYPHRQVISLHDLRGYWPLQDREGRAGDLSGRNRPARLRRTFRHADESIVWQADPCVKLERPNWADDHSARGGFVDVGGWSSTLNRMQCWFRLDMSAGSLGQISGRHYIAGVFRRRPSSHLYPARLVWAVWANLTGSGQMSIRVEWSNGSTRQEFTHPSLLNRNGRHHIAVIRDGSTLQLRVNNVAASTGGYNAWTPSGCDLLIGGRWSTSRGQDTLGGWMSDVALWNGVSHPSDMRRSGLDGWRGERARARLERLCDWAGIDCDPANGTTVLAGMKPGNLLSLMQDTASADGGISWVAGDGVMRFKGRAELGSSPEAALWGEAIGTWEDDTSTWGDLTGTAVTLNLGSQAVSNLDRSYQLRDIATEVLVSLAEDEAFTRSQEAEVEFGQRPLSIESDGLHAEEAWYRATFMLAERSKPIPRVRRIRWTIVTDADAVTASRLEPGNRVRLIRPETGWDRILRVERVTHSRPSPLVWEVDLELSEPLQPLVLDDPTFGVLDEFALGW